jgi:hypothetical protein
VLTGKHSNFIPLLEVYNSAAWKQTFCTSDRLSSIDTCIPNPASGFTFGNDSKSVDLTKKLPWNVCMANPLKQQQIIKVNLVCNLYATRTSKVH